MEQKLAYNLYHRKKNFVNLLKLNEFDYNQEGNILTQDEIMVGRILNSLPPYVIVHLIEKGDSKSKKKAYSKLVKLAIEFSI